MEDGGEGGDGGDGVDGGDGGVDGDGLVVKQRSTSIRVIATCGGTT